MNIIAVLTLVLLLSRIFSACMTGKRNGVLVAEFSHESPMFIFKPNIRLPSPEDGYRFNVHSKPSRIWDAVLTESTHRVARNS